VSQIRHGKFILAAAIISVLVLVSLTGIFSQSYEYKWWDARWHYRIGVEINSTNYSRKDWPIEYDINFTKILGDINVSAVFDENSTRVLEYNSTGSVIGEIPSQLDKGDGYNAAANAVGTVVFSMNGTTQANQKRYFYIYFDTIQYGNKSKGSYATDLSYNYTGNVAEFNVNNSLFRWWVSTVGEENTSGINHVQDVQYEYDMLMADPSNNRTVEYSELSNATDRFGFDFRNNATLKYAGPVRIVVEQRGNEILWNQPDDKTNEGYLIKRYTFYRNADWMRIEQTFVNNASYSITRNSTVAGALAVNLSYTFGTFVISLSNPTDPGSYGWADEQTGTYWTGIVNLYENGTSNFFALEDDSSGRIGIQLNTTSIPAGSSIKHAAALQFNSSGLSGKEDYFRNFVNQSIAPLNITTRQAEAWTVVAAGKFYVNSTSQASVFNRNETVVIAANVSDLYNLSEKANVTIDTAGAGTLNITLYDDGSHNDSLANDNIFANAYDIKDSDSTGVWNVTFRTYNASDYLLNTSWFAFNVTNTYNVTVNITNPTGFTDRLVNSTVYVRNYRNDRGIVNATLNCTFAATEVPQQNISDNGNGTYSIWFTAPSYANLFTLSCSATRNNNTGLGTAEFTTETYYTNVSITPTPSNLTAANVTSYSNQTFNISVLAKNTANGSAYDLNITIVFSSPNITANTTFLSCGDVLITKNCTKTFQIIVLNSTPKGNYTANITARWRNSNISLQGYNYTLMNITVLPNPILSVPTDYVLGIISAGKPPKNIQNFTVYSMGNEPLQNATFNVSGFPANFTFQFIPPNFSWIGVGISQNVQLWVNASNETQPSEYNGTINVTTANDGFKTINVTIAVSGTNMTLQLDNYNFTAGNVSWYSNQSFPLLVSTENIGNATAYNVTVSFNFSSANIVSNVTPYSCGNVPKSGACNASFLITVLAQTHSGNYTANVSVQWENPESGTPSINIATINITVLSHINLTIPTASISSNITHGTEKEIGIIILNSTGNDPVENISFAAYNFSSDFYFEFIPQNISSLGGEYAQGAKVNVTARFGTPPGVYTGIINVTSGNDGYKEINVTLTVPASRTWSMNVTYCERVESPEEGKVCDVFVNNTGNAVINFTITPVTNSANKYNNTWTNETNFTLINGTSHVFEVWYNITGQTLKFYHANYTVDAVQSGSSPDSLILQIVLNPYIKPSISVGFDPNQTEQLGSVWIYANVTDQSGAGIDYNGTASNVTVTVTRPDGSNSTVFMSYWGGSTIGGTSIWRAQYPDNPPYLLSHGNWGNTTRKGYYNASVFVVDNQGKNNTVVKQFLIYSKLSPFFTTMSNYYYSKSGPNAPKIFYKSLDFSDDVLPYTNVTFEINNSNGTIYRSFLLYGNLTTQSDGYVIDPSTGGIFLNTPPNLLSDLPLGNYTATAHSVYYVPTASVMISDTSNYTFQLLESGGTLANILVYPVWYPAEGIVKFKMWVTNALGTLTDPAGMNLTVTMPITGNPFFNRTMAEMTKISDGVYIYTHNLPSNPSPGVYDVTLNVTGMDGTCTSAFSAFRIGVGGPYDVKITNIENTVYQNDYLDFTLYIKNMGDAPTENHVEYWVADMNNTPLETAEYYEQLGAGVEKSELKSLYIWNSHPPGNYILKVMVTYDNGNMLYANASAPFSVIQGGAPPTPGPPSPGGPTEAGRGAVAPSAGPKIEITKYPQELGIEQDSSKYPVIEVKNTGGSALYNISLRIIGIPSPWIQDISPKRIDYIPVGNSSTFTVTIKIPPMAEAKEYAGRIIADANVTTDQKSFSLTVFTTRAQLIRWEIDRLKKALQEFEIDVENGKKVGKNVEDVLPYIDQIKEQIRLAEDYLQKKMYDESLSAVQTGWSMLETARYLLAQAPFIQILIETIFPPWLIALLIVLVIAIIILLFFVRRMKAVFDRIFRMQAQRGVGTLKPTVVVEKMKERESLEKEETNIRRVLGLLEREFKEGLISENAYMDLKRRNDEKLAKIRERKSAVK
jgi:uncharacterized membrane protein